MCKSLVFGDLFLAHGLHLKSHQRCSAAFCRPVKFFHTDWIIISLWSLPYTQRHCHVRIEKSPNCCYKIRSTHFPRITLCSSSSSSPLLSLVQVPAKLAINLSIHTQHTYDNGVDRTGDRVFRKYSFLHEEREEEKNIFNPQTMLHLEYSLRTEKKTPQHKSTYTINTWHCNRGKHIQLWQAAIRSSAMRRRSQTCSP